MSIKIKLIPKVLHFKRPAGTSRGSFSIRKSWYILIKSEDGRMGIGECAPLPDLSCDDIPEYEQILETACLDLEKNLKIDYAQFGNYPSILFGLETALRHFEQNSFCLWDTEFSKGNKGIPINGLIWMGSFEYMREQIEDKLQKGFRCVKLKIGAIDFDKELELLAMIRKHYPAERIQLRVDANGAFSPDDALDKLKALSAYDLHSIEQPIRQGQWDKMYELCRNSPIPIALDEELIGVNQSQKKAELLDAIKPQYIILKPSLHGGIKGSDEWITLAKSRGINFWITSALESNIGLNAIAQWCATYKSDMYQGLGTGLLFTDNVDLPLYLEKDMLWFNSASINEEQIMNWLQK